jgi:hypothetical protein
MFTTMPDLTLEQMGQIETALASGWKLDAIRIYGEVTGKGLRESKDFIEALILQLIKRDPQRFAKLKLGHGGRGHLMLSAAFLSRWSEPSLGLWRLGEQLARRPARTSIE